MCSLAYSYWWSNFINLKLIWILFSAHLTSYLAGYLPQMISIEFQKSKKISYFNSLKKVK